MVVIASSSSPELPFFLLLLLALHCDCHRRDIRGNLDASGFTTTSSSAAAVAAATAAGTPPLALARYPYLHGRLRLLSRSVLSGSHRRRAVLWLARLLDLRKDRGTDVLIVVIYDASSEQ